MKIIIGLGNPSKKYDYTRHNVGFMVINTIGKQQNLIFQFNKKFNSEIIKNQNSIFIKPQTFMNNSGQSAKTIMSYYKLLPKKLGLIKQKNADLSSILTVIHDDIDIDLGKYKISINSSSAGHNGVQSIINHLKTKNFKRIRIGVKTEMIKKIPIEKFVLQEFNKKEIKIINNLIPTILVNL